LARRLWQKLLKVLQKVGCRVEECGDLGINVLDWLLFSLIRLEDLEELFVNLGLILEAVLSG
jgi:hypothetical protein